MQYSSPIVPDEPYGAPLWPAGHFPHLWGDQMLRRLSPIADVGGDEPASHLPISPLVGEMSGRTEGDATGRDACRLARFPSP
ncbi:hypothetical protein EN850_22190 [Mesorhizobium sp. M8A.F.Ca.ET.207.01.1.1]|nr:hypothetical protein EN850_22190 [Mesorhizobium sp. M8A.F.Ca.ET.207.01.1.1]